MDYIASVVATVADYIPYDLSREFLGNSLFDYTLATVIFVGVAALFKLIQWQILRRLAKIAEKTETDIDDTLVKIVKSLKPAFYWFVAFFFAVKFLAFPTLVDQIINGILIAWLVAQGVIALQILVDYVIERKARGEEKDSAAAYAFLGRLVKWALWLVALLLVLSNLGVNITSLVAGLGIGGIAIAFALQSILGDLFSSFSIWFDKPFEIGDFIVAGDEIGTVERVGIKTTRLRALQGEEIVISNQQLTSSKIHNYKKMARRRIVFAFGVAYETPTKKLEKIPAMVREIFDALEKAELDRVHFKDFGDSALNFEVVYFVTSNDYYDYMDTQQIINLELKQRFEKEKITFAYPVVDVRLTSEKKGK